MLLDIGWISTCRATKSKDSAKKSMVLNRTENEKNLFENAGVFENIADQENKSQHMQRTYTSCIQG